MNDERLEIYLSEVLLDLLDKLHALHSWRAQGE